MMTNRGINIVLCVIMLNTPLAWSIEDKDHSINLCQSGFSQIEQPSYSQRNFIGALSLDFTEEILQYTKTEKPVSGGAKLCECTLINSQQHDMDSFDVNIKLDSYQPNLECSENCADTLQISSVYSTRTFGYGDTWFKSDLTASIFSQDINQQKIVYTRNTNSPPSINRLKLHITASQILTVECQTTFIAPTPESRNISPRYIGKQDESSNSQNNYLPENAPKTNTVAIAAVVIITVIIAAVIIGIFAIKQRISKKKLSTHQRLSGQNRGRLVLNSNHTVLGPAENHTVTPSNSVRYVALEDMRDIDQRVKQREAIPEINPDFTISFGGNNANNILSTTSNQNNRHTLTSSQIPTDYYELNEEEINKNSNLHNPSDKNYYNMPGDDGYQTVTQVPCTEQKQVENTETLTNQFEPGTSTQSSSIKDSNNAESVGSL